MKVKIIWLDYSSKSTQSAEAQLADALSKGWRIVGAGGGGHVRDNSGCLAFLSNTLIPSGFVIIAKQDKA